MLSILCVILTIKVKVGIPESFKVGWYPLKKTGSSHLNSANQILGVSTVLFASLGSSSKRGLQQQKRLNPESKPPPTALFFFAISLGFHSNDL